MKDLIYFPYFEPQNDRWLKFSLLYMDKFRPIIPYNRKEDLSDLYKQIINDTDLVKPYSPRFREGIAPSLKTISDIDNLLINIEYKNDLFGATNLYDNIKNNRNYFIYNEKFSSDFAYYCIKNDFATESEHGLHLSEELAYIFMTNLAKSISYQTDSSIITDSKKFNNYSTSVEIINKESEKKMNLAENVINLKLPININDIRIQDLIKFRNDNRELLKVFNNELNKISNINDISRHGFLENYNNVYMELMKKISIFGVVSATVPFSIYTLLNDNDITVFNYQKEMMSAIGGIASFVSTIKPIIKDSKDKRQTVKYFANLKDIV